MKTESKSVPYDVCSRCNKRRPVHVRNPRILCANCYAHLYPSKRRISVCANFANCPQGVQLQEIWARGLCSRCWNWFYRRGRLDEWPIPGEGL